MFGVDETMMRYGNMVVPHFWAKAERDDGKEHVVACVIQRFSCTKTCAALHVADALSPAGGHSGRNQSAIAGRIKQESSVELPARI